MSNVIQLNRYRKNEAGRTPLFVSHLDGTVRGFKRPTEENFGDRINRIKESLEKINNLMKELKRR